MFTTNNRRNRTAAIITIAAASVLVTNANFAAPKRDVGRSHNRENTYIVTVGRPATPPNGSGDHDITTGAMRNRDLNLTPEPAAFSGSLVTIGTPAPFPTGNGHDITASALTANGPAGVRTGSAGSPAASAPSRGFLQALDMTSSVRYVGASTAAASARNPFADGRAWASLDRDGRNGLVATAGWSFLLK